MKLRTITACLTLLAGSFLASAQPPADTRGHHGTPPTAAEMIDHRVQRLTTQLDLTAAQQAQAKTIFTDEATASEAIRPNLSAARTALSNAVKTTGLDTDIEQAAAALGALQTQATVVQAKAQAKFRGILTTDQKTKLDDRTDRGSRMGGFDRGRPF